MRCYIMKVRPKKKYAKSLRAVDVEIELIAQPEDYVTYIKQGTLRYMRMMERPDALREELSVDDIAPMGDYIRGHLGGRKRGYAGLIIEDFRYDSTADIYYVRLANLRSRVGVPGHFIRDYWKKLIYAPRILPFHFIRADDILLSDVGAEDLRNFLRSHILSSQVLSPSEKAMVQKLIAELKQPEMLRFLNDKYYVIYRRVRAFAAVTITPDDIKRISENNSYGVVVIDTCAYATLDDGMKAYYYSGVLNYLLFKLLRYDMGVARNQYARPLAAIVVAGLQWRGEDWQAKAAELSRRLHARTPSYYGELLAAGRKQVKLYLKALYEVSPEFAKLIDLLDQHVDEEQLRDALALVSG